MFENIITYGMFVRDQTIPKVGTVTELGFNLIYILLKVLKSKPDGKPY